MHFFATFFIADRVVENHLCDPYLVSDIKEQWSFINTRSGIALRDVVYKKHQLHYTYTGSKQQFPASENLGKKNCLILQSSPCQLPLDTLTFHLFKVKLLLSSFSNAAVETLITPPRIPCQICSSCSLAFLILSIHSQATSLYYSQYSCPCFHHLCNSLLCFSLTRKSLLSQVILLLSTPNFFHIKINSSCALKGHLNNCKHSSTPLSPRVLPTVFDTPLYN